MKKIILVILLIVAGFSLKAQQYPIYSQYFSDPFLYNVGYVGNAGYMELNLNYRQQWIGLEDAPVTSTFNLQIPTKGNVSFAVSAYTDKAVLLRNSAAFFTFGYRVAFSDRNYINFGLSAGSGFNNIDISQLDDISDPAIANAYSSSVYLDGQFGIYYVFKNLNIGASLPKLFGTKTFSTEEFQEVKLSPLDNMVFTVNYSFDFPRSMLSFTPYLLYRTGEDVQKQVEATGILKYRDVIYIGGGYRMDYGASILFGLGYKDVFQFGYAYEIATQQVSQFGQGTHEFQLKFKLGKQKRTPKTPVTVAAVALTESEDTTDVENSQPEPEENTNIEPKVPIVVPLIITENDSTNDNKQDPIVGPEETLVDEEPVIQNETLNPDIMGPGIYVVVGVFESEQNAINHSRRLNDVGFKNELGINENGFHYIIVDKSKDMNSAKSFRKEVVSVNLFDFRDAWILEIE